MSLLLWIKGGKWKAYAANFGIVWLLRFAACALHCAVGRLITNFSYRKQSIPRILGAIEIFLKEIEKLLGEIERFLNEI